MNSQNTLNKLSRRNWLRDAAIATAGTAVLPSFLTSCTDHAIPPGVGEGNPGTVLLTAPELERARQNLINMIHYTENVKLFTVSYESQVWALLKSGKKPTNYNNFITDAILKIMTLLLEAALSEIPGAPAVVGAVFGLVTDFIKTWESNNERPPKLDASYAAIGLAMDKIQQAMSDKLNLLADPGEDHTYKNLREAWQGEIEFNGKKYTLKDLVTSDFPTEGHADFVSLRDAAVIRYQQTIWNLLLIRAGTINFSSFYKSEEHGNYTPTEYARDEFYRDNKAAYLRGYYKEGYFYYRQWYFEVDGLGLTDDAARLLFKDDSPGHVIHPEGLFSRDFVFKQFRSEKYNFSPYHELRQHSDWNHAAKYTDRWGFDDGPDDYNFTGGLV